MDNIFLIILVFVMIGLSTVIAVKYDFKVKQAVILSPTLFFLALFISKLTYYIDYGEWGGQYFYGTVMFFPIVIIPLCLLFKLNYLRAADFTALITIFMMVFGKLDCMMHGCCTGIQLFELSSGQIIYFPSRTLESLTALAMAILFYLLNYGIKHRGLIYGYFLIIYGVQRSFFEMFRIETPEYRFSIPVAYIWCAGCVILGIAWLILMPMYKKKSMKFQEQIKKEEDEYKLEKIRKNKQKQAQQRAK